MHLVVCLQAALSCIFLEKKQKGLHLWTLCYILVELVLENGLRDSNWMYLVCFCFVNLVDVPVPVLFNLILFVM